MARTQKVIREQSSGVTPKGKKVYRETTRIASPEADAMTMVWSVNRMIFYVTGVIETLLTFRFLFKAFGANPSNGFVSFIYSTSSVFEGPFRGIFRSATTEGIETTAVIEPSTIFAMIMFLVLAIGLTQLINVLTANDAE